MSLWTQRLTRFASAHTVPEQELLVIDARSTPSDMQAALRSVNPNPKRAKPWTSKWDFLIQYKYRQETPKFINPTEEYRFRFIDDTGYQIRVAEEYDPKRVRDNIVRQAFANFAYVAVITAEETILHKRISPSTETPPRTEPTTIPEELLVLVSDVQASTPPDELSKGINKDGRFLARIEPESYQVLKHVSEQENLSLNEALNLILLQFGSYPRDWKEIHAQIQFNFLQLELVQDLIETSQRHEEMMIRLLESGSVEELSRELRALENERALRKASMS